MLRRLEQADSSMSSDSFGISAAGCSRDRVVSPDPVLEMGCVWRRIRLYRRDMARADRGERAPGRSRRGDLGRPGRAVSQCQEVAARTRSNRSAGSAQVSKSATITVAAGPSRRGPLRPARAQAPPRAPPRQGRPARRSPDRCRRRSRHPTARPDAGLPRQVGEQRRRIASRAGRSARHLDQSRGSPLSARSTASQAPFGRAKTLSAAQPRRAEWSTSVSSVNDYWNAPRCTGINRLPGRATLLPSTPPRTRWPTPPHERNPRRDVVFPTCGPPSDTPAISPRRP